MIYKEIKGVGSVTLMTRVTGFRELQSEMSDRNPCSSFMMESAWPIWGVPLLPTCVLVWILSDSIDSGGRLVSRWRFRFRSPLAWGSGELSACGDASVFLPSRAIVVGHT